MDLKIEYTESAFGHHIEEADIVHAIANKIRDKPMKKYTNKYGLVGFDRSGNLLEIVYNPLDEDTILVFHTMKCRMSFLKSLDEEE
ncbi:hypothetical protein AGMMS50230_05190 [Spirochaetia bacterium]|nr:hypothetical protein AGMMS50230_05190 [Spirochaetia bacterium]